MLHLLEKYSKAPYFLPNEMRDIFFFSLEFTVLYNIISMSLFLFPSSCLYVIYAPGRERSSRNILCRFSPFMSFSYLILYLEYFLPLPPGSILPLLQRSFLYQPSLYPFSVLSEENEMCSLWPWNIQLALFFLSYITGWLFAL